MSRPIALVSGGSRGIGAATVLQLAATGHDVCFGYHQAHERAQALCDKARAYGGDVICCAGNLAAEADVLALFDYAQSSIGLPTRVIHNAGVVAPRSRVDQMSVARIESVFALNVTSVFVACREAVRRLSTAHGGPGGVIVNVSSIAARIGSAGEYVDYAASKAAIDTLTQGLAMEVADEGIRVVGVRPGTTDTEIHASGGQPDRVSRVAPSVPMKRAGTAEEIAAAICWVASDEASYMTGTSIDVGGGR